MAAPEGRLLSTPAPSPPEFLLAAVGRGGLFPPLRIMVAPNLVDGLFLFSPWVLDAVPLATLKERP
jgi:hypothetical protein